MAGNQGRDVKSKGSEVIVLYRFFSTPYAAHNLNESVAKGVFTPVSPVESVWLGTKFVTSVTFLAGVVRLHTALSQTKNY